MSDMKNRMLARASGGAVDLTKALARSPADAGGSGGGNANIVDREPRLEQRVGLG